MDESKVKPIEAKVGDNSFELILRILGNEFVAIKIGSSNFSGKLIFGGVPLLLFIVVVLTRPMWWWTRRRLVTLQNHTSPCTAVVLQIGPFSARRIFFTWGASNIFAI